MLLTLSFTTKYTISCSLCFQGVSCALVENSRTLRLPTHLHERLSSIRNAKIRLKGKGITPSVDVSILMLLYSVRKGLFLLPSVIILELLVGFTKHSLNSKQLLACSLVCYAISLLFHHLSSGSSSCLKDLSRDSF